MASRSPTLLNVMNRARLGFYGTTHIRFGNNVSHSKRHTRRSWKPNVQTKTYASEILGQEFKLPIVTREIRTVEKRGGFDRYILSRDKTFVRSDVAQLLERAMRTTLQAKGQPAPATVRWKPKVPQWLATQREQDEQANSLRDEAKRNKNKKGKKTAAAAEAGPEGSEGKAAASPPAS